MPGWCLDANKGAFVVMQGNLDLPGAVMLELSSGKAEPGGRIPRLSL